MNQRLSSVVHTRGVQPVLVNLLALVAAGRATLMNQQLDFRSAPHDAMFFFFFKPNFDTDDAFLTTD